MRIHLEVEMKQLSDLHKIKYIHVIQPNQWYRPTSNNKYQRMFDHKTKGAIEPFAIESGYPLLLETSKTLGEDIHILELTKLFDEIPSAHFNRIYRDDCCHFTEKGSLMIAKEVVKFIAASNEELAEVISTINVDQFLKSYN